MHDAIHGLIRDRYRTVHDASPAVDYPTYLSVGPAEAPRAVIGFRFAGAEALFLERYLDQPVERLLSLALDRPVPRSRIVELGAHASARPTATVTLWREAAAALDGQADFAVAVLTAPMRVMFGRLGLPLVTIGVACRDRLDGAAAAWGRYYDTDPMVCAGDIHACHGLLDRRGDA